MYSNGEGVEADIAVSVISNIPLAHSVFWNLVPCLVMSRIVVLPVTTLQALWELADGLSLVQLVCVMFWWVAIVVRRVCDTALEICGDLFLFLYRKTEGLSEYKARDTEVGLARVSREKEALSIGGEEVIEVYLRDVFENREQWWDNRLTKKNPRALDFKHKITRKALWIDNWFTPSWVGVRLERENS